MKILVMGLSGSRRNEDVVDLIDEYADLWGISFSAATFKIVKDYNRMSFDRRLKELECAK